MQVRKLGVGRPKLDRRKPECVEVDLECMECIRLSASNVALLVPSLTAGQLRSIFTIIYPEDNCRPMMAAFLEEARPAAPARRPAMAAAVSEPAAAVA